MNRYETMTRIRTLIPALALAALLGAPTASEAQLGVSDNCFSGLTGPCSLFLAKTDPMYRPIELAFLEIDLLGGWEFNSTPTVAWDLFGPLPPLSASFGVSASSMVVDFLSTLNGPDPCFPFDPFTCNNIFGFVVGDAFTPPTFVELDLAAPASGGVTPEYAWRATDIDGTIYQSGAMPGEVVPEPSTWILLASGLAGIGLVAYRRREQPEGTDT